MRRLIVDDLINEVRSLMDQDNEYSLRNEDILMALNASYDRALHTISKAYPEPLLKPVSLTPLAGQTYTLPLGILEDKIRKVEIRLSSTNQYTECTRVSVRDRHLAHGHRYYVYDNKLTLAEYANQNAKEIILWIVQDPLPLDVSRGEIVSPGGPTWLYVDNINESLSLDALQNSSYINIIDGENGNIKGTHQINSIVDSRIDIKTTPFRESFRNEVVTGALAPDVVAGDYICFAGTSCIPFRKKPISNFLVQFAVARLNGKLGEDQGIALSLSKSFEEDIESLWTGRENSTRIKKVKKGSNYHRRRWR